MPCVLYDYQTGLAHSMTIGLCCLNSFLINSLPFQDFSF